MEYLAGGTLADALRSGEIWPGEAVRWLREAASALDYAHRSGVIHRDIKPANFLLDGDRVLRVADFGIARPGTEDTITSTGQMLGTASYLAPERALGRPATDASDRYALAVAAFELLVGERPFTAETSPPRRGPTSRIRRRRRASATRPSRRLSTASSHGGWPSNPRSAGRPPRRSPTPSRAR